MAMLILCMVEQVQNVHAADKSFVLLDRPFCMGTRFSTAQLLEHSIRVYQFFAVFSLIPRRVISVFCFLRETIGGFLSAAYAA